MGSAPEEQSIMVMAITAADDCTQNVMTPPSRRNTRVVEKEVGSKELKKESSASFWPRFISVPVIRRVPKPKSKKERPKRKSPMKRYFFK